MVKKTPYRILVVDDEEAILEMLTYNLETQGYEVRTASNGKEALVMVNEFIPHLVLLDLMMPGIDGIETCRRFRANLQLKDCYIVFLTARFEEYTEVDAFNVGADDYIVKPIKPRALLSRIAALFRRRRDKKDPVMQLKIGSITINRSSHTVQVGEKDVFLPRKEFELLYFLVENPNKIFSREDLLQNIWGVDVYVSERTVDVHVRKVREKIGEDYITTVKGVGYKFHLRSQQDEV